MDNTEVSIAKSNVSRRVMPLELCSCDQLSVQEAVKEWSCALIEKPAIQSDEIFSSEIFTLKQVVERKPRPTEKPTAEI